MSTEPLYPAALDLLMERRGQEVSHNELAAAAGCTPFQIHKVLAYAIKFNRRGAGVLVRSPTGYTFPSLEQLLDQAHEEDVADAGARRSEALTGIQQDLNAALSDLQRAFNRFYAIVQGITD